MTSRIKKISIVIGLLAGIIIGLMLISETREQPNDEIRTRTASSISHTVFQTGTHWLFQATCNLLPSTK
ncbi:MAG TPA: hypothetical protein PK325_09090 [Cyclobacteriaceae bacterium]|nr:hypothetical protein [Cyclobacteriaceae bacterium]HMV09960.1 hypothetical protein [Cyclobacteriaceae bacterium]HMV90794.1 hypothetical protein [Cyclobacteriaceae bacterium]HMX01601.1 hypothetical protein [Cyclobacteriaceae bacterium]HMX50705.1 hypothetical protein [Cyclobacteriaceae bacterium]